MAMKRTALLALALAVGAFTPLPAGAQSNGGNDVVRTPDGQPDISGVFTFRTLTPLERPAAFEGQDTLDPEEAAQFEASERIRLNRDLFDPETGAPNAGYQSRAEGGVLSYNEFWYERGIELTADKRTALVVDPPDGPDPLHRRSYREARAGAAAQPSERLRRPLHSTGAFPTAASSASTRDRR